MKEQRDRARADALAKRAGRADTAAYQDLHSTLSSESAKPVQFIGYTDATARVARASACSSTACPPRRRPRRRTSRSCST